MIAPQPRQMGLDMIAGEMERHIQINIQLQEEVDRLNTKVSELEQKIKELELKSEV